jgi:hypothetical protein
MDLYSVYGSPAIIRRHQSVWRSDAAETADKLGKCEVGFIYIYIPTYLGTCIQFSTEYFRGGRSVRMYLFVFCLCGVRRHSALVFLLRQPDDSAHMYIHISYGVKVTSSSSSSSSSTC